jgi:hypothetical protein
MYAFPKMITTLIVENLFRPQISKILIAKLTPGLKGVSHLGDGDVDDLSAGLHQVAEALQVLRLVGNRLFAPADQQLFTASAKKWDELKKSLKLDIEQNEQQIA